MDGKFALTVSPGAVLKVSYIGYLTKEQPVGNPTNFTIELTEDTQAPLRTARASKTNPLHRCPTPSKDVFGPLPLRLEPAALLDAALTAGEPYSRYPLV